MLTAMAPREVSSYGVQATNTFSIRANGKAFKVLIDGLYSDKIRAVVRELCRHWACLALFIIGCVACL